MAALYASMDTIEPTYAVNGRSDAVSGFGRPDGSIAHPRLKTHRGVREPKPSVHQTAMKSDQLLLCTQDVQFRKAPSVAGRCLEQTCRHQLIRSRARSV
jgi:hypothetical protein